MNLVEVKNVIIEERQRKEKSQQTIESLKKSIQSKGLLHAPVLAFDGENHRLIAGEHRIRAMEELHRLSLPFSHDGVLVPHGFIPYVSIAELLPEDLAEAELEENILRAPLYWMEEMEAKTKIHALRVARNPEHTKTETAREIAQIKGTSIGAENISLHRALLVKEHKNNPKVQKARSLREAYKITLDDMESTFRADLVTRGVVAIEHDIILGDCREELPKLKPNTFDAIISDPPYGIEANKTAAKTPHLYDDNAEEAIAIYKIILRDGFRLLKPRGIVFLFCDIEHFLAIRGWAIQYNYSVWRTPIVWWKGNGEGHAPWGRAGFIRASELLFMAVKGQAPLLIPGGSDVMQFSRTSRNERVHAAEKPVLLLAYLLRLASLPGGAVLDPCAGSAPIIEAANIHKVKITAIEKNELYYKEALARASKPVEFKEVKMKKPHKNLAEMEIDLLS